MLSQPPFNPQYPPPYPGQWPQHLPSVHSNITETSELITQVLDRQFKLYQDREDAHKEHKKQKEEREKKFREDNNNRNRINKAFEKINRFDGSNPDQCKITPISKLLLSAYLPFNRSNKNLKSRYKHTMQGTSHSMSWHTKALPLKVMGPKLAASLMPTLYMGNVVTRWKGGSTRGYPKTYKRHSRGPWTLNPGSSLSSAYIPGKSMRSTTLMSAATIKNLKSMRLNTSETQIIKVRIMIQITKRTKITTIVSPTALTTTRTAPTMATTPPPETSGTTTRVTTQNYHQT